MRIKIHYLFLAICLVFASEAVFSQDVYVLEVSTASKKKESIFDAPGLITVIGEQEISGWGGQNLGDVLNRVTSFYFMHAGTYFYNLGSIRAQNMSVFDNHVLILLNGRPVRDGISGGHNNYFYLSFPVNIIKQIEVVRGPGSVLYGTNAYSGVINVITKEEKDNGVHGNAALTYGSFNTLEESVSLTMKRNDFFLNLAARNFNDDGAEFTLADGPKNGGSVTETGNFEKDNQSVFINSKYKNLTASLFYGNAFPYALIPPIKWGIDYDGDGGYDLEAGDEISSMSHFFGDLGYEFKPAEWASIAVNGTYNYQLWKGGWWDSGAKKAVKEETDAVSDDILGEVTVSMHPEENLNVIVGATYENNKYSGHILNDGTKSTFSSYLQLDYKLLKKIKLIGGIQYNKPDNVDGAITPRLGAVVNFTDKVGLKLLHGSAFRSAYPQETDVIHPVYRGDKSLKPEIITTSEAQLSYQTSKFQASGAFYMSHMKDLINKVPDPDSITQFKFSNEGSHDFRGIELESKYSPNKKITVLGSFTYQENESDDSLKLSVVWPSFMFKVGAIYNHDYFSIGIFNNYIGQPERISNPVVTSNPEANAYSLLSLKASTEVLKLIGVESENKLKLSVYADNLLDEKIWIPEFARGEINTLPLRNGRALWGSLMFEF